MVTTIQITENLQQELTNKKAFDRETYEEVIWDLIEDTMELNEQTKKDIAESRAEVKAGKIHTISQIKKELKL